MNFSEKLTTLRKRRGLSQEQLAELLDVSRQSVSKWESQQALPETAKIIMIGEIFNVSTDLLLKDEQALEFEETPKVIFDSTHENIIPNATAITPSESYSENNESTSTPQQTFPIKEKKKFRKGMLFGVVFCIMLSVIFAAVSSADRSISYLAASFGLFALMFLLLGFSPKSNKYMFNMSRGIRKGFFVTICVVIAFILFVIGATSSSSDSSTPDLSSPSQTDDKNIICDVSKFANISSSELINLLGKPDNAYESKTVGFSEFPCVYYEYNNADELGYVNFILINDEVVKMVSDGPFPYNKGKNLLESLNLSLGENCAKDVTSTYAKYRCVNDTVDEVWITCIDEAADTYTSLQVTYDMFYYDEWYIPLKTVDSSNIQWYTQEKVKTILKSPSTAKFPNITKWAIWSNKYYTIAQSYVDAQNGFGATVRSEFTFVYFLNTNSLAYAVFDGEVILNNGYVETKELVDKLIDKDKTKAALSINTTTDTEDTKQTEG